MMNAHTTSKDHYLSELPQLRQRYVLGQRLDAITYADATTRVLDWAKKRESRYVCVTNVHVVMEGWDDPNFRKIINDGDLVTPDGVPLVWCLRALGVRSATRIYGPDLTLHICEAAAKESVSIGLYGGTTESLKTFVDVLKERFPRIHVACAIAPPFRALTAEEDVEYTREIQNSCAQILFVGIGCPKQEKWMSAHHRRLSMPMLGVGAAFDFHAGRVKQAPAWMQRLAMEWLYRLFMEPRRLWRRYVYHNPRFVLFFAWQYLSKKRKDNTV